MTSQGKEPKRRGDFFALSLFSNLRFACRHLLKKPGFTVTAVLSLAIGIGANTAIFTLINAVLIRDSPLEAPNELLEVYLQTPDFPYNVLSYPDFYDLRDGTGHVFSGVTASKLVISQTDRGDGIEVVAGEAVSGNYFELLGIEMAIGRPLLPEDDVAQGAHPVTVLGYDYWQKAYGGDPQIVGKEMRISDRPYSIVGVAPADYEGNLRGLVPAFYATTMMVNEIQGNDYDEHETRGNHSNFVKARLAPGVTLAEAQAAVDGLSEHIREQEYDDWDPGARFSLIRTSDVIIYPPIDRFVRAAAWLLSIVVALVLLMACTNLASFLLAQAVDRRKEIALRIALGASRGRLVGQLLTESLVLALVGGVAGIGLAVFLLRALLAADLPLPMPLTLDLGLDPTVLAYTLGVSILAGIVLGLAPALQSSNPDIASTLKDEGAGGGQPGKLSLRNALIAAQVAASTVLLVGAGLFLRSMQEMQTVDPGFGRDPAAVMTMMVPGTRFDEDQGRRYLEQHLARFAQLPGVERVGITSNLHLNTLSTSTSTFNVDGHEPPPERQGHTADTAIVDPGFFDATGVDIVAGRNFNQFDTEDRPRVAIVSQALAQRFWPGEDPIGRMLRRQDFGDEDLEIVGVASDAKVRTLGEEPRSFIYRPYSQSYTAFLTVVAKTSLDPESLALELLATARRADPDFWAWETKTMEHHIGIMLLPARLSAMLLSVFAALAIGLAAIGLYGVVSYAVSQRTREIGIRMSLGADAAKVIRMLMSTGIRPVIIGGVLGLGISFAVGRLVGSLLFGVDGSDLTTYVTVSALLGITALIAALLPALRASRIDPVTALHFE